jgi:hypothetical protein
MTKARDLANGGFGLVLMKPSSVVNGTDNGKGTVSFSGTSVTLNGVFNSTYDNYRVVFQVPTSSSTGYLLAQFCTGNSANSTSNYNNATWAFRSGNAQQVETANENDSQTNLLTTLGNGAGASLDIINPFSSSYNTMMHGTAYYVSGSTGSKILATIHGTRFQTNTSFDGIKFNFGSNTQIGTVSVYGYNK